VALLANILADPGLDHTAAVGQQLHGSLRDFHVVSIVRSLERELNAAGSFCRSQLGFHAGMALHAILYHLLGGATTNIPPPPLVASKVERDRCLAGWAKAVPAKKAFYENMRKARDRARSSGSLKPLHAMRSQVFAPETHKNLRGCGTARKAGGGGSEPPAGSASEQQQQTDRLRAFAMGTHIRLGEGYAHRPGPCGVRLLARNDDMLRQIAARVLELPPRTLAPPDRELLRVRRLLWKLELELQAERASNDAHRLALDDALRDLTRALEREANTTSKFERWLARRQSNFERELKNLQVRLCSVSCTCHVVSACRSLPLLCPHLPLLRCDAGRKQVAHI
jgi:hypothetical protein